MLQILLAQWWKETPCVIESSSVGIHGDGEDTLYDVDIAYRYTSGEESYRSKRYAFGLDASPSGERRREAVVERYPPGRETVCFVNPWAPAEAVLNRGWQPEMGIGFIGLFFAAFFGAAFFLIRHHVARHTWEKAKAAGNVLPGEMPPQEAKFFQVMRVLGLPLAWNGLVAILGYAFFFATDPGENPLWVKIILGAMAFVGLNFLWEAVRKLRPGGGSPQSPEE